jgi:hypothetical protein
MTWLSQATSWVGKNIGNIVSGAGSVLSLVPGVGTLAGAGLMAVGGVIQASKTGTVDLATAATNQLIQTQAVKTNMTAAGVSTMQTGSIVTWIKNNLMIVLGIVVIAGYFLLKRKHRR